MDLELEPEPVGGALEPRRRDIFGRLMVGDELTVVGDGVRVMKVVRRTGAGWLEVEVLTLDGRPPVNPGHLYLTGTWIVCAGEHSVHAGSLCLAPEGAEAWLAYMFFDPDRPHPVGGNSMRMEKYTISREGAVIIDSR